MQWSITPSILAALGLALAAGVAQPAAAQTAACVYLQPGAGYAAKMRLTWGSSGSTPWSSSFAIGKHACQNLAGNVPSGSTYNVQVKALAGQTKTCTPSDQTYDPNFKSNVTFNASGTTQNVKCAQPN